MFAVFDGPYRCGVKVRAEYRESGQSVVLLFVDAGVHVLDRRELRGRIYLVSGAAIFIAIALGAGGVGAGHAVNPDVGVWLAVAALSVTVAAGLLAAVGWLLAAQTERRVLRAPTGPTIAADTVTWARSTQQHGVVTVSVGLVDGTVHTFTAAGVPGTDLAGQFARVLKVGGSATGDADDIVPA